MSHVAALPPRLQEVARHVPRGVAVADVGTDHARLPAALVADGWVPSAIGVDARAGPLNGAAQTLARLGVTDVALRLGDGLQPIGADEVRTVVLAGLGGAKIIALLDAWPWLSSLGRVVLQPNTQWPAVRAWVAARRWQLDAETMITCRGHAYLTLAVDPSVETDHAWADDPDALLLGPRLMHARPAAWRQWVAAEYERLRIARRRAEAAGATDLAALQETLDRLAPHRTPAER
ncbi:MAG: class I SAM-dependent methyltransferase [Myxococcota bacterium]